MTLYHTVYEPSSVWFIVSLYKEGLELGPVRTCLALTLCLISFGWRFLFLSPFCSLPPTTRPYPLFLESEGLGLLGGRDGSLSQAVGVYDLSAGVVNIVVVSFEHPKGLTQNLFCVSP